jgi:hypothetical protein
MSREFFGGLHAGPQWPDLIMNQGPLPDRPPGGGQFAGIPDGEINERVTSLLGDVHPYAYGTAARMATQTQLAHPHRVQLAIPVLCIPAPQADGGTNFDPKLEHVFFDGDVAFTLQMPFEMLQATAQYCLVPYGIGGSYAPLVNLATVNYILWGLQVGSRLSGGHRWQKFFMQLCQGDHLACEGEFTEEMVFRFLQTFIRPFGVMHGSEKQGGQHEGKNTAVTFPVDYVSTFAVAGKLLKVNNLWRNSNVSGDSELVLELVQSALTQGCISFELSANNRRTERVQVPRPFFYLSPTVPELKSVTERPRINLGIALVPQQAYETTSHGQVQWNALACTRGLPLEMIFAPRFEESDRMWLERRKAPCGSKPVPPPPVAVPAPSASVAVTSAAAHLYKPLAASKPPAVVETAAKKLKTGDSGQASQHVAGSQSKSAA